MLWATFCRRQYGSVFSDFNVTDSIAAVIKVRSLERFKVLSEAWTLGYTRLGDIASANLRRGNAELCIVGQLSLFSAMLTLRCQ